eukprot:4733229-Amphidinium_carterae.1
MHCSGGQRGQPSLWTVTCFCVCGVCRFTYVHCCGFAFGRILSTRMIGRPTPSSRRDALQSC